MRNLSLCRQIFEHCDFIQNSPWFQKLYRKFNPIPFHWATGFFSSNGLYVEKYLNIAILFRISPPRFQK